MGRGRSRRTIVVQWLVISALTVVIVILVLAMPHYVQPTVSDGLHHDGQVDLTACATGEFVSEQARHEAGCP